MHNSNHVGIMRKECNRATWNCGLKNSATVLWITSVNSQPSRVIWGCDSQLKWMWFAVVPVTWFIAPTTHSLNQFKLDSPVFQNSPLIWLRTSSRLGVRFCKPVWSILSSLVVCLTSTSLPYATLCCTLRAPDEPLGAALALSGR